MSFPVIRVDMGMPPENAGRNARRYTVKAHLDENTCEPCRDNDGKVYRNRTAAFKDYPNGRGYTKCVGAQFGNTCRCTVIKRGNEGKNMDLAEIIAKAQSYTDKLPASSIVPEASAATALRVPFRAIKACSECRDSDTRKVHATHAAASGSSNNALYIYDMIGGWDGTKALDVALALRDMDGPVDLHLNSPGGIIFEGAAMYNALRAYTGGPITSYVDGYAASAASFVMLAASPYDPEADTGGVRFAKNASAMVHDGNGFAMGTADDMREVADLLDMLSDQIAAIYAEHCGGTMESWREIMRDGDNWYTADAAKTAGLATHIVGQTDEPPTEPDPIVPPEDKVALTLDMFGIAMPPQAPASLAADALAALKGVFG